MPTISIFYGIIIQMFYDDHNPPHFHAKYGEDEALIDIHQLLLVKGRLPRRALELVLDWAELHQEELIEDWNLCMAKQVPHKIQPLK